MRVPRDVFALGIELATQGEHRAKSRDDLLWRLSVSVLDLDV